MLSLYKSKQIEKRGRHCMLNVEIRYQKVTYCVLIETSLQKGLLKLCKILAKRLAKDKQMSRPSEAFLSQSK
jgi:hypothetical protein